MALGARVTVDTLADLAAGTANAASAARRAGFRGT